MAEGFAGGSLDALVQVAGQGSRTDLTSLANRFIFLLSRMTGNTEAGKTTNASDAKNQSLTKATTISTTSDVVSFKKDVNESVRADRSSEASLLIREINVPLG